MTRPCCPAGARRHAGELLVGVLAYEAWRASADDAALDDHAARTAGRPAPDEEARR